MQYLKDKGIPTALYYPVPLHSCPIYANYDSSDMTLTNNLANRVLSLPMHPYLSIDEVEKISRCLKDGISKFS